MNATIIDTATAKTLVNYVKRGERVVYPDYIRTNDVTTDNVGKHVSALTAMAFPNVKPNGRADRDTAEYAAHTFRNKVRNGLNTNLPTVEKAAKDVDWLRLIRQAVENGIVKGGLSPEDVLATVLDVTDLEIPLLSVVA